MDLYFSIISAVAVWFALIAKNSTRKITHQLENIKLTQLALKESEEQFKSAFQNASIGMALVGPDGKWLRVNKPLLGIVGFSEEELLQKTFHDITYPEDRTIDLTLMQQILENKIETYEIEKRYIHIDGHVVWVLLNVSPVRNEIGNPSYFILQIQDISTKKVQEVALREKTEESDRLLAIIEKSTDYIGMADMEGNLLHHNSGAKTMVGLPTDSNLCGMKISEMHPVWAAQKVAAEGIPAVLEHGFWTADVAVLHRDGREIPVSQHLMLHRDSEGNPKNLSTIMRDMTDRIHYEEALFQAKLEADNSTRSKSEFLANMSHEIRTPLTSIIGYSESLITDKLTEQEQHQALTTVIKNGNHLLGIINDILDISKIDAGKLDVEIIPVDLAELISDVANLMQHRADEKGLSLGFEYEFPIPRRIFTDPIRLKQILINLVGNAVKFTSTGGVKINLIYKKEREQIDFAIIDTGPGLTPEQSSRLFKAFSQADTTITRKFGGTGLGFDYFCATCGKTRWSNLAGNPAGQR